ncbi:MULTISPECIES: hypothetical protein [unclassified Methylobacterium]|uniref:hypothetical protein n=1 Tax=unclassified Methylobacterium TaxID=2615210 RepID=UPI0003102675|nr:MULTISPECIES: hypothetical protein [Methylobacterium]WFT78386.1 hypothetical protein QA634_24370 [Methylobacterium nodulans]
MSQTRSLTARAEAVVAQARQLAADHHALLAAVRAALKDAPQDPPGRARTPERI